MQKMMIGVCEGCTPYPAYCTQIVDTEKFTAVPEYVRKNSPRCQGSQLYNHVFAPFVLNLVFKLRGMKSTLTG